MPNSLRSKLSKLRFQGKITQDEYKELIEKLEGHDEALVAQIKWERDTAIEQLKQLGYGLGEKIEPCDDCVSRQAAIEVIYDKYYDNAIAHDIVGMLFDLPSVKPQRPSGEAEIWERIKEYVMSDGFMDDYPEDVIAEIWMMRKELEDLKND